MARINYKSVKVNGNWQEAIEAWRVKYGKKNTPIEDREYSIYPGAPVGTIKELRDFCKANNPDISGILLADPISNCTFFAFIDSDELVDLGIRGKEAAK